jgi:hypothetical protein
MLKLQHTFFKNLNIQPPHMEFFPQNLIIYDKNPWVKYGNLNFSPSNMVSLGDFLPKQIFYTICVVFLAPSKTKIYHKKPWFGFFFKKQITTKCLIHLIKSGKKINFQFFVWLKFGCQWSQYWCLTKYLIYLGERKKWKKWFLKVEIIIKGLGLNPNLGLKVFGTFFWSGYIVVKDLKFLSLSVNHECQSWSG